MKHVCQVGHNAGHSGVAMIDGLSTTMASFDLFSLPYSKASQDSIDKRYPGRVKYFRGRSQTRIREYAVEVQEGRAPPCDLWFIDGDHWNGALLDMKAALTTSRESAIIIADDCTERHTLVMRAWRHMVDSGFIVHDYNETFRLPMPAGLKGWYASDGTITGRTAWPTCARGSSQLRSCGSTPSARGRWILGASRGSAGVRSGHIAIKSAGPCIRKREPRESNL